MGVLYSFMPCFTCFALFEFVKMSMKCFCNFKKIIKWKETLSEARSRAAEEESEAGRAKSS